MNTTFGIGIPTLNRYDWLLPALHYYAKHDFTNTNIHIIDNGDQGIVNNYGELVEVENAKWKNLSVAASWNRLCQKIFTYADYALILNDDIYFGRKQFEVELLLHQHKFDLYLSHNHWSVFIIPKATYIKVGQFDEDFYPAYYEDNDYMYRMRLKGMAPARLNFLNPVVYNNSQTLLADPTIKPLISVNKSRYIAKWGGEPDQESFLIPYNITKQ